MDPVIIMGGGPAGSALGSYLSLAGIKNVIFEGVNHPREHVGESLVPSTTRIFNDIGFLETMEREGFVKKFGASWHPPKKKASLFIKFCEFPQEGVDQDYTYHVDRGKFDHLLLQHAESLGSKVIQGAKVKEVLFGEKGAEGVRLDVAGQSVTCPASLVVDATGRNAVLGRQLGLKKGDPNFNQFAVHAWYSNVDRGGEQVAEDIHIHFLPVERGWVWQIPINDRMTSIGVVAEKAVFKKSQKDYDGWFKELIHSAPDIEHAMRDAHRENDFKVEADYSYSMEKYAGDGFVLVGDAARFVDPIFSSGVSVALYSAKFAAESIAHAFEIGDFSAAVFEPYEKRLRRGTSVWYEFIRLYYKLLPLFTRFIQNDQHRHQVLQLLQGDVYDRDDVPVLDAMRKFIEDVEKVEGHVFKPYLDPDISLPTATSPG
jgi:flavin-dependent dehydrogenase